jgi:hypothetical protein
VDVIKQHVSLFADEPHGILLRIVWGFDGLYEDADGVTRPLLEMSVTARRELAGKEFRGRSGAVQSDSIRLDHEPFAVDRVVLCLIRQDVDLTGVWQPDHTKREDGSHLVYFLPGETVPVTGPYDPCERSGTRLSGEVMLTRGDAFPEFEEGSPEFGWRSSATSTEDSLASAGNASSTKQRSAY